MCKHQVRMCDDFIHRNMTHTHAHACTHTTHTYTHRAHSHVTALTHTHEKQMHPITPFIVRWKDSVQKHHGRVLVW